MLRYLRSDTLLEQEAKTLKTSFPSNSSPNSKAIFLQQAGALSDDSSLADLRDSIYQARGRSETDDDVSSWTDTLTHLHSGNTNVINRLENLQDEEVAITIVTKLEILRGRIDYLLKAFSGSDLLKAQELFSRSETLLNQLPVILIDPNAANQFDRLQDISKFRKIGRSDLLIASIALANQAQLVTRNLRHFRQIPHLFLENWVD